jgi:hypothetical protein
MISTISKEEFLELRLLLLLLIFLLSFSYNKIRILNHLESDCNIDLRIWEKIEFHYYFLNYFYNY